jgi:hypothetical protein
MVLACLDRGSGVFSQLRLYVSAFSSVRNLSSSPNGLAQDGTSARYLPVAASLGFSYKQSHLRRCAAMDPEKPTIRECGYHDPIELPA